MLGAGTLKLVVRAGAGYNTIDVAAASRRGIYVSNCPGKNSIAVAELAFALILALDRRLVAAAVLDPGQAAPAVVAKLIDQPAGQGIQRLERHQGQGALPDHKPPIGMP